MTIRESKYRTSPVKGLDNSHNSLWKSVQAGLVWPTGQVRYYALEAGGRRTCLESDGGTEQVE
jgi:hypothetical protein